MEVILALPIGIILGAAVLLLENKTNKRKCK